MPHSLNSLSYTGMILRFLSLVSCNNNDHARGAAQFGLSKNKLLICWFFVVVMLPSCVDYSPEVPVSADYQSLITHKKYYPNGQLSQYLSMRADNTLEGESIYYYDTGKRYQSISYKNGRKHGPSKIYYPNGNLHSEINYVNGLPDGPFAWYYKNGEVDKKGVYEKGLLEDQLQYYHANGVLKSEVLYRQGKAYGGAAVYDTSGLRKSWYYHNLDGEKAFIAYFDEDGKLTNHSGALVPIVNLEKDKLSWDNILSVQIRVAVPPGFTGEVQVRTAFGKSRWMRKKSCTSDQNSWVYLLPKLQKKNYTIIIYGLLYDPEGELLISQTAQHLNIDLQGRTPGITYGF